MGKFQRSQIRGFGRQETEIIACDANDVASCVSVYLSTSPHGRGLVELLRINVYADLMGIRSLLGSAFVTPPFRGLVLTAAGFAADAFHVTAQALSADTVIDAVSIGIEPCCSTPGVLIPRELQNPPPEGGILFVGQPLPEPLTPGNGLYEVITEVGGFGPELPRGQRVLRIVAQADDAPAVGTIDLDLNGRTQNTITIAGGTSLEVLPNGNLVGPAEIGFTNVVRFVIETVR